MALRIALLGASGQLGNDVRAVAHEYDVELLCLDHDAIEVTDAANVADVIAGLKPDVVINCAAFHQVDRCEENPELAFQVNAVGAGNVAKAAAVAGARSIYVSTDYVFDGAKPPGDGPTSPATAYTENDAPSPLNVYGASKLAGEHLVSIAHPRSLVARVSSLYGISGARGKGGNFIETILGRAANGPLQVVNDQWMTPTFTQDAAHALLRLATLDDEPTGIVHVTNPEACTWHAFAAEAVRLVGLDVPVNEVPASTWPSPVRRPANSALATGRLADLIGAPLRPWRQALAAYLVEKGHVATAPAQ